MDDRGGGGEALGEKAVSIVHCVVEPRQSTPACADTLFFGRLACRLVKSMAGRLPSWSISVLVAHHILYLLFADHLVSTAVSWGRLRHSLANAVDSR